MPAKKATRKTNAKNNRKKSPKKTTNRKKTNSRKTAAKKITSKVKTQAVYTNNPFSFKSFMEFLYNNFSLIFMLAVVFIAGFIIGSIWIENKLYKQGFKLGQEDNAAVAGVANAAAENLPKVTRDDHIIGKRNAKVVIVEYSDYECPFCAKFHPTLKQIHQEYGNDVAWVYRHFPLSFHQNAQLSAEVGECIAKYKNEDAFWEYTDYLYENIGNDATITNRDKLLALAEELGAKRDKIEKCIDNGEMTEKVKQQQEGGSQAGVGGTPALVIVTKKGEYDFVGGAVTFEQLKSVIDKYL